MHNVTALITGASRGVGRGIALALLAEGATVHVTGRTRTEAEAEVHPQRKGSLETLEAEAAELPGRLVSHVCDHRSDQQTEAAVSRVIEQEGRLDLLVNNAWPGYERMVEGEDFTWVRPFWEQPMWRWEAMIDVGVRAAFVTARAAAPTMIAQQRGLMVNISFWAAQLYDGNAIYGIAKAAIDKMAADFAHELRPHKVAAVSLYPGLVRTEAVMRAAEHFDLSNSESPQFLGHVVAALWRDPKLLEKSGQVHVAAVLAKEYGVIDIDGKRPEPLTRDSFAR